MLGLGSEEYPLRGNSPCVQPATDTNPIRLHCTVSQSYLIELDKQMLDRTGSPLHELAASQPRDAYARIYHLFRNRFIDTRDSDWAIGSPEQDGERAFNGLVRYMEEKRAPDPDIEEIDVVIAVWKRASLLKRLQGTKYDTENVLQFHIGPQDLAAC